MEDLTPCAVKIPVSFSLFSAHGQLILMVSEGRLKLACAKDNRHHFVI
jgi:hypothetical protein